MGLIDLTGFGSALNALSFVYWAVAIFAFYLARSKPASAASKRTWTTVVVLVFGFLPAMGLINNVERNSQAQKMKTHVALGDERFKAYCQKAGVKINRVVENVDGVYLMKVRTTMNLNNQYEMDDPYGNASGGENYIKSFLIGRDKNGRIDTQHPVNDQPGYRFVEAIDPKDGKLYRFTGKVKAVRQKDVTAPGIKAELEKNPNYDLNIYAFVLDREPISQRSGAGKLGIRISDISASMCDGSRRPTGAESNEKTSP